ncbi:MAG TPA: cupin domain-containing protein [Candidatus Saccharimonadales bacterium]|nr:cupin domain-containing protein [Candidatus Saccharimonadales bacterium]
MNTRFSIEDAIAKINQPWTPIDLTEFNGQVLRIALFQGEYKDHSHEYDEFFTVYQGKITIITEDGNIELDEGEGAVIPKGITHKPVAKEPAYVLMIDAKNV